MNRPFCDLCGNSAPERLSVERGQKRYFIAVSESNVFYPIRADVCEACHVKIAALFTYKQEGE